MSFGSIGFGPSDDLRFTGIAPSSGRAAIRYPTPWLDIAQTTLPRSPKQLFDQCLYQAVMNPLVSAVTRKMAAYPITEIVIDDEPDEGFDKHKTRWEDLLFRVLKISQDQIEYGLDYQIYGNCLVSILYPFHKYLQCTSCGMKERIKKLRMGQDWDFRNFKYMLSCPRCGNVGDAKVKDEFYKSYRDIKLIRWYPGDISIDYNPITRETEYAYTVPEKIRTKVLRKTRSYLETLPHGVIEALRLARPFVLTRDNIYHWKAPTPTLRAQDEGWGFPPIMAVLKDTYYLQQMKKAQEMILHEHMVPLDILFPTSADQAASPYLTINLADWRRRIETELLKWRQDPNYKPILPVPVGYQRIGGTGKALMLTQEIRAWSEHIVIGMGVPQEFAFGGLTWSGSSVSLRMLENTFLTYRDMHENFLQHFLIPNIARFMGWTEVSVHMKAFKMADDMQAKQLLISLNQMKKISDKSLLAEFDKDALDELKLIEQEMRRSLEVQKLQMLYTAQIQGEAQQIAAKFQAKVQNQMNAMQMGQQAQMGGNAPPDEGTGMGSQGAQPQTPSVLDLADGYSKKLSKMAPEESASVLQRMKEQMPELHDLVQQKMNVQMALTQEPLPEQRPPRRANALI